VSEVGRSFELRAPADPGLGVTVRVFVTESARRLGLGDADIEDLRLAATELLANAVETAQPSIELILRVDAGRWVLRANGAGGLDRGSDGLIDRADLLDGLADVRVDDGIIELSSDVTAPENPD
jgi:hypothetical protein